MSAVCLGLLVACSPGDQTGQPSTVGAAGGGSEHGRRPRAEAAPGWNESCDRLALQRDLLALVGPDGGNTSLYAVRLCPFSIERRGTARTTLVTSDGGRTFVTSAHAGLARLYMVSADGLVPVPGLGTPRAFNAFVSQGRLAYAKLDDVNLNHETVHMWDLRRRRDVKLYDSRVPLGFVAVGPKAGVATFELPKRYGGVRPRSRLILIRGGSTERVDVGVKDALYVVWNKHDDVLLSPAGGSGEPAVVVDASSGKVEGELPVGWAALAASPDGQWVLAENAGEVALFRQGEWGEPNRVGRVVDGRMWQATWPPRPAALAP